MRRLSTTLLATGAMLAAGCSTHPGSPEGVGAAVVPGTQQPVTLGGTPAESKTRSPMPWAPSLSYTGTGPYPVSLSDVPANVYDPNNKLDTGRTANRRFTKRISEQEQARLRAEAMSLLPNSRIQQIAEGDSGRGPQQGVGFESLDINDCCGGGANVPPDPELAAGPDHVIAVVNVAFAVYDTSGTLLSGPTTFSSFFSGTPGCTGPFDPNVVYDEAEDRFILGVDGGGDDYCIAATTGSDPLGTWNRYSFATDISGAFFDYPHAGVGRDAIYMGSNQFGGGVPGGFEGRVFAIDKFALYSGGSLSVVNRSTGSDGTPQPMNLHGFAQGTWPDSGPHYIMTEVFDGRIHSVWEWNDPFGSNTFFKKGNVDLNAATGVTAGFPIDAPQSGSSADLQANDWRGLDTEYRNGEIWMTNSISCNPGGGTVDCIRWARIDPTAVTLSNNTAGVLDAGVFSSAGDYRLFPDLAVNDCGDMAIGYTKTSTSIFPSVFVTGREAGDPPGTLQGEVQVKAGELSYTAFDGSPHRWGDYSGMTIAPDGQTFWYLGEYSENTGNFNGRWGTYIASFDYPNCAGGGGPDFTLAPTDPGLSNQTNDWDMSNGTPGGTATLFASLSDGTATVNVDGCPPLLVNLGGTPVSPGNDLIDGSGNATVSRFIPAGASGKTVRLQAVDGGNCSVSNLIVTVFDQEPPGENCSSPNLPIPDDFAPGVDDSLTASGSGSLSDLNVSIVTSHTYVGDLVFTLRHEDTGTSVTLIDRPGVPGSEFGCEGNDIDATLDDEAGSDVEAECAGGTPTINGTFRPNGSLSAFDGEDLSGTWTLNVADAVALDTGIFNSWCLEPTN